MVEKSRVGWNCARADVSVPASPSPGGPMRTADPSSEIPATGVSSNPALTAMLSACAVELMPTLATPAIAIRTTMFRMTPP
jgi:hypothetical protein